MAAPSKVAAARQARDADIRIDIMAEVMRKHEASDGACTFAQLAAAGFSEAEIEAYRDPARERLSGRAEQAITLPEGRVEGIALVQQARAIRARHAEARV